MTVNATDQLKSVDILLAIPRALSGKTSDIRSHGTGPQAKAKARIYKVKLKIAIHEILLTGTEWWIESKRPDTSLPSFKMANSKKNPKAMRLTVITRAVVHKRVLRPALSTIKHAQPVPKNCTAATIMDTSLPFLKPASLNIKAQLKRTALMPQNCWKNITAMLRISGFVMDGLQNSEHDMACCSSGRKKYRKCL